MINQAGQWIFMKRNAVYKTTHYDKVAKAWPYIFGRHFHFGYFENPHLSLDEATGALNDMLLEQAELNGTGHVLDVGCGIGGPAFYLKEKLDCTVVGISTSRECVALATAAGRERNLADGVRFMIADGTDTRLPAGSFDLVWMMESSHTMKDKKKLFGECFRLLKPGGKVLAADVMPRHQNRLVHYVKTLREWGLVRSLGLIRMRNAFGPAWTESLDYHTMLLERLGYRDIITREIGEYVRPTFACWKENIRLFEKEIRDCFSRRQLNDFLTATDLVDDWYRSGLLGYGLIAAAKPV